MNLSKTSKLVLAKAGQASAGTEITSDVIDTAGFEGCLFFGSIATANAANFAKAQQGQQAGGGDMADLAGTKVVPGDNGDSFLIDVHQPRERYLRCVIDRGGANTATGDVYALLYGPRVKPVSHGATVDAETHVSPAEGTP